MDGKYCKNVGKLRCARCGVWLSPSGQGLKNGYKLVDGKYVHEQAKYCKPAAKDMSQARR